MSNNDTLDLHPTLGLVDGFDLYYMEESDDEMFLCHHLNDEMEGMLLFRFGDMDLGRRVLGAIWDRESILTDNYMWIKQAEKGRMSEESACNLCSDLPEHGARLISEHGPRLFAVLRELREEWGVPYRF